MAVKRHGGQRPTDRGDKLFVRSYGVEGVGKTRFALSFPGPFYIFNLDRSMDHLLEAMPEHIEYEYEQAVIDVDVPTVGTALQYLAKFDELMRHAHQGGQGTVIIDGWDILWDIVKIAKVKNLDNETLAKEYAPANEYMNSHLRRLGTSKLNVVLTTFAKQKWTGMKTETQQMITEGFKYGGRWITHELYHYLPDAKTAPLMIPSAGGPTGVSHMAHVNQSKLNEKLIGKIIPNPSYQFLFKLTFGRMPENADKLGTPNSGAKEEPSA